MGKFTLTFLLTFLGAILATASPIQVIASIPDFAVIAKAIGGNEVEVDSIVKGNRDVHSIELLPSLMLKVRKADIYIKVGLDLDLWAQQIIDGSRNAKLVIIDASTHIKRLEVPSVKIDASMGDIHAFGNPHYWLDPANAGPIGQIILDGLSRLAPDKAVMFKDNLDEYMSRIDAATKIWQARLEPFSGAKVISYHDSWPYFTARFKLQVVGFMEPKPGIPPSPSHIANLQTLLKSGQVKAILLESYFDDRIGQMLSRDTGVPLVKVPVLVGSGPDVVDQFSLFDTITKSLANALDRGVAK